MAIDSFTLDYGKLNEAQYGAGTTVGDIIRGAGSLACNVARNYTNWSQGVSPLYFPFQQGFFDALCGPGNSPPPPSLPFTGGQCASVLYDVTYTASNGPDLGTFTSTVVGPVIGVISVPAAPGQQGYALKSASPLIGLGAREKSFWQDKGIPSVINVVKHDGTPDTCGSPPPSYRPTQPSAPDLQVNAPVYISPSLTIQPTFVYVRPTIDVDINAPIKFDPNIKVQLPDLNLEVSFGPFNVTVNPIAPSGSSPPALPPDPRTNPPTPGKNQSDCTPCDLTGVNTKLDNLKTELDDVKKCACPKTYTVQVDQLASGTGATVALPANTFAIRLTLTQIPTNASQENGAGGPDVYYAGWFAFGTPSNPGGVRQPIHFASNTFFPPEDATSFSFTVKQGYQASVQAAKKVYSS